MSENPRRIESEPHPAITTDIWQIQYEKFKQRLDQDATRGNADAVRFKGLLETTTAGTQEEVNKLKREFSMYNTLRDILLSPEDNVTIVRRDSALNNNRDIYFRNASLDKNIKFVGTQDPIRLIKGASPAKPDNPNGYRFATSDKGIGDASGVTKRYVWAEIGGVQGFIAIEHVGITDDSRLAPATDISARRPRPVINPREPTPTTPPDRTPPESSPPSAPLAETRVPPSDIPTPTVPYYRRIDGRPLYRGGPPSPPDTSSLTPATPEKPNPTSVPRSAPSASPTEPLETPEMLTQNKAARDIQVQNTMFENTCPLEKIAKMESYEVIRTSRIGVDTGTYSIIVRNIATDGSVTYKRFTGTGAQFNEYLRPSFVATTGPTIALTPEEQRSIARADVRNFFTSVPDLIKVPVHTRTLKDISVILSENASNTTEDGKKAQILMKKCASALATLGLADSTKTFGEYISEINGETNRDYSGVVRLDASTHTINIDGLLGALRANPPSATEDPIVKFEETLQRISRTSDIKTIESLTRIKTVEGGMSKTALNVLARQWGGWTPGLIEKYFPLLNSVNALEDIMCNPAITNWNNQRLSTRILNSFINRAPGSIDKPSMGFLSQRIDLDFIRPDTLIYVENQKNSTGGDVAPEYIYPVNFLVAGKRLGDLRLADFYYQNGKIQKKTP